MLNELKRGITEDLSAHCPAAAPLDTCNGCRVARLAEEAKSPHFGDRETGALGVEICDDDARTFASTLDLPDPADMNLDQ